MSKFFIIIYNLSTFGVLIKENEEIFTVKYRRGGKNRDVGAVWWGRFLPLKGVLNYCCHRHLACALVPGMVARATINIF